MPYLKCIIFMAEGRHFLQIPGPSNVPDRVLRAIDNPTIDHRGPDAAQLVQECLHGMRGVFQTKGPVVVYSSSGTGAWEAALVNTLSPGDRVVAFDGGYFATAWAKVDARSESCTSSSANHAQSSGASGLISTLSSALVFRPTSPVITRSLKLLWK